MGFIFGKKLNVVSCTNPFVRLLEIFFPNIKFYPYPIITSIKQYIAHILGAH